MKHVKVLHKVFTPLGLISVAILTFVIWIAAFGGYQTIGLANVFQPSTTTVTTTGGCAQNPTLAVFGTDALQSSQNVSPSSYNYSVIGAYIGTAYANPAPGDKVDFLASSNTYLTNERTATIGCGPNNVPMTFYKYGNLTASIYTDAGTAILSNGVASTTTNETALAVGSSKNNKVHLVGSALTSSGVQFVYVEFPAASKANISSVSLSGLPMVAIPSGISSTNVNPYTVAFQVPALVNGDVKDYNLQYTTTSTGSLMGVMRITFYAQQDFADTDGTFKVGIYDSLNNAKFKDKVSYNFVIGTQA